MGLDFDEENKLQENIEKIQKNTQKIYKNSELMQSKSGEQVEFKPQNDEKKSAQKRVFYVEQVAPSESVLDKLRAENEALKKENSALKEVNKSRKEKGFYYAEILTSKGHRTRERERQLLAVREELAREEKIRKQEAEERERRAEKERDLIRQRKDIQYGLDYIQRKADWWRNKSEQAYQNAMMCLYTNLGNPFKNSGAGLNGYGSYMAVSLMALRYSLDYQHDLEKEREKILHKERELDRLLQK